jgi:hypothetical protein
VLLRLITSLNHLKRTLSRYITHVKESEMLKTAIWMAASLLTLANYGCNSQAIQVPQAAKSAKNEGSEVSENGIQRSDSKNVENKGTESAENEAEESDVLMAIEPVSVGGAFLVCLEQPKGAQSTAQCRLESDAGAKTSPPQGWQLTYYVQTPKEKVSLSSEDLPMDDPNFTWTVMLGKYKLANVMVEIFDAEKGTTTTTSPIPMDPKTLKAKAVKTRG